MTIVAAISFPRIDPVFFRLGPFAVRWYGMAYLLGFAVAYGMLRHMVVRGTLRLPTTKAVSDLISWLAFGVIFGGRMGWWLFYHRAAGTTEPWYEPFAIWHGGMSFHGGLVGVAVALFLCAKVTQASYWNLADSLAIVSPIGLFFGRLANFINAELVGRPTSVPWAVIFPGESIARHPSQLYEAVLEGPLLFVAIWAARKWYQPGDGRTAAFFLIFYGILRFVVEFTRQPDEQIGFIAFGWLSMGQLLSAVLAISGLVLLIVLGRLPAVPQVVAIQTPSSMIDA